MTPQHADTSAPPRVLRVTNGTVEVIVRVAADAGIEEHALAEDAASAARAVLRGAGGALTFDAEGEARRTVPTRRGRLIFNEPET